MALSTPDQDNLPQNALWKVPERFCKATAQLLAAGFGGQNENFFYLECTTSRDPVIWWKYQCALWVDYENAKSRRQITPADWAMCTAKETLIRTSIAKFLQKVKRDARKRSKKKKKKK